MVVNDVNEMTNFIKTIVLKNDRFKNDYFFGFSRRFHNETIVFLKNENVNIPTSRIDIKILQTFFLFNHCWPENCFFKYTLFNLKNVSIDF